jgi:hypothetical protein
MKKGTIIAGMGVVELFIVIFIPRFLYPEKSPVSWPGGCLFSYYSQWFKITSIAKASFLLSVAEIIIDVLISDIFR